MPPYPEFMTRSFTLGIALWPQQTSWRLMMEAAELVDVLGFEHLWTVDHWLAPHGAPDQPIFDGWSVLSAWAARTRRVRLGLFVAANTFRPPTHTAKLTTTLDHISDGRAIIGLGAGWFAREHAAYGIDFGSSPGERIGWLDEAAGMVRRLLDGESVSATSAEGRYEASDLRLLPRPVQAHVPMAIGGSGEKKTLRVVAKHADMWNTFGSLEFIERKIGILHAHCAAVGRDPADIELTLGTTAVIRDSVAEARAVHDELLVANHITAENNIINDDAQWFGPVEDIVERIRGYQALGITSVIVEMPAPYDTETIRKLATEVLPRVNG